MRSIIALTLVAAVSACNTQATSANPRRQTAVDSAEQVMYSVRMAIATNGVRRGEAYGDTVLTFDAATRFGFRILRVQFASALARPLGLLTAPGGMYSLSQSVLETQGAVVIVSDTSRRRIETRAVRYDPSSNQLVSDSSFVATSGSRKLSGIGFTADPGLFSIKCVQRCTGSLGP